MQITALSLLTMAATKSNWGRNATNAAAPAHTSGRAGNSVRASPYVAISAPAPNNRLTSRATWIASVVP